jgi:hypothetical protein
LLKGTATIDYRSFDLKREDITDFAGLVTAVDLSYVLLGVTQLAFGVQRDVGYSYRPASPYYLQATVSAGVTQRFVSRWAAEATGFASAHLSA